MNLEVSRSELLRIIDALRVADGDLLVQGSLTWRLMRIAIRTKGEVEHGD